MLKRIIRPNWWLASAIVVLLIVRHFEPFRSSAQLTMMAALAIGVVTVLLMAIVPKMQATKKENRK
jgi:hypothetical protein